MSPRTKVFGARETGSWRTDRPIIDHSKCKLKCRLCLEYCPEAIIFKPDGQLQIDLRFCKGCGICAEECPSGALKMVKEATCQK